MKYVRRKYFKQYRREGLPFVDCAKLARLRERYKLTVTEFAQAGYKAESVTLCECCGPEVLRVWLSDGKAHDFSYYDLKYRGEAPASYQG